MVISVESSTGNEQTCSRIVGYPQYYSEGTVVVCTTPVIGQHLKIQYSENHDTLTICEIEGYSESKILKIFCYFFIQIFSLF